MLPIDMQALPAWLSQQRWFGGKGAQVAGVRDLDRAQISPGLLLSAVEVRYAPPRPPESYALALRHLREPTAEDRPGAAAFEAYIAAESLAAKFRRRLTSKVRRAWRGTSPNTSRHAHAVRRDREATITS